MRTDVRWLLFWLLLTILGSAALVLALTNDASTSAGIAVGVTVFSALKWTSWSAAVRERHHAERGHR